MARSVPRSTADTMRPVLVVARRLVIAAVTLVAISAGVTCAPRSSAASPGAPREDVEAAREHYRRALNAYDLGKYPQAIAAFEAAYEAKPDPALLYNIAQAHRLNGDLRKAVTFYRTYLRKVPKAPNRAEVEQRIDALERQERERELSPEARPSDVSGPRLNARPSDADRAAPLSLDANVADAPEPKSLHERWWFWAAVGAAVVGATVAVLATQTPEAPSAPLGTRRVDF